MISLGIDPGYGNFKIALVTPEGVRVAAVPSVVGVGRTDMGLLSPGTVGRQRRRTPPARNPPNQRSPSPPAEGVKQDVKGWTRSVDPS